MGVQALAQKVTRPEAVARSRDAARLAILVCVRADLPVLVAGQDAVDAGADHLREAVLGKPGVARVVESLGESPREPDALIELADGQEPGVAGKLPQ